eukprot:SAG31_NODE_21793_length_540_cov_4.707483_1_plen_68_part_10
MFGLIIGFGPGLVGGLSFALLCGFVLGLFIVFDCLCYVIFILKYIPVRLRGTACDSCVPSTVSTAQVP